MINITCRNKIIEQLLANELMKRKDLEVNINEGVLKWEKLSKVKSTRWGQDVAKKAIDNVEKFLKSEDLSFSQGVKSAYSDLGIKLKRGYIYPADLTSAGFKLVKKIDFKDYWLNDDKGYAFVDTTDDDYNYEGAMLFKKN